MSKLDIKKDKWFFDPQDEHQSRAFQEWLFAQGFQWASDKAAVQQQYKNLYRDAVGANSGVASVSGSNSLGFADRRWYINNGHTELFPNFKTVMVVDSVELPELVSPQEKQIRELEKTIARATQQIQELKENQQ